MPTRKWALLNYKVPTVKVLDISEVHAFRKIAFNGLQDFESIAQVYSSNTGIPLRPNTNLPAFDTLISQYK